MPSGLCDRRRRYEVCCGEGKAGEPGQGACDASAQTQISAPPMSSVHVEVLSQLAAQRSVAPDPLDRHDGPCARSEDGGRALGRPGCLVDSDFGCFGTAASEKQRRDEEGSALGCGCGWEKSLEDPMLPKRSEEHAGRAREDCRAHRDRARPLGHNIGRATTTGSVRNPTRMAGHRHYICIQYSGVILQSDEPDLLGGEARHPRALEAARQYTGEGSGINTDRGSQGSYNCAPQEQLGNPASGRTEACIRRVH